MRANNYVINLVILLGMFWGMFWGMGIWIPAAVQAASGEGAASISENLLESYEQRRRDIAAMMEAATVWVLFVDGDGSIASGSGFVVADGYIMTNAHVVEGGRGRRVFIANQILPFTEASIVDEMYAGDSPHGSDFALLRFRASNNIKLPILSFNTDIRRMDRVSAWGYPVMITQFDKSYESISNSDTYDIIAPPVVYTEGVVSTIVEYEGQSIIHTAAIAGGNSGGPLVDRHGRVVGINTWGTVEEGEGAFVNASLLAGDVINFLRRNNLEPLLDSATSHAGLALAPAGGVTANGQTAPSPSAGTPGGDARVSNDEAGEYLSLANQGDIDAITYVGAMYLDGDEGFPEDFARSAFWLEKAAQGLLGMLYLLHEDMHDPVKGLYLLEQSARHPETEPEFQALLAMVLYGGESLGVAFNPEESLKWAQAATDAGDATAKALLGFHYYDGYVVDVDEAKALQLANEAYQAGDSKGKALLAIIQYDSKTEFNKDPQKVINLARQAADDGEAGAQGLLARIYAFEPRYQDNVAAERWARQAAGQADCVGQYVLGWLYLNGIVVEANYPMAYAYLKLSDEKIYDMGVDDDGPLLDKVEKLMSAEEKRRAQQIINNWHMEWKLSQS